MTPASKGSPMQYLLLIYAAEQDASKVDPPRWRR